MTIFIRFTYLFLLDAPVASFDQIQSFRFPKQNDSFLALGDDPTMLN